MDQQPGSVVHSQRYIDALGWAAELHRHQQRKVKPVPSICHLLAVSALVWEDGGDEEQAIAALLHDAIEDAGVSAAQITGRFGQRVAQLVLDCTETAPNQPSGAEKEAWLERKTRHLAHLQQASLDALLICAADKAHNARDVVLDARRDPSSWQRFSGGLEGSAWFLLRVHQLLSHRLPESRSVRLLGESVQEILRSKPYSSCMPQGIAPAVWAAGYAQRQALEQERATQQAA